MWGESEATYINQPPVNEEGVATTFLLIGSMFKDRKNLG